MRRLRIRIFLTGIIILVYGSLAFSQDSVQSVYNRLLQYYTKTPRGTFRVKSVRGKCGLERAAELIDSWNKFSPAQKQQLQIALGTVQSQKDRIIGHFHFYYDTTGADAAQVLDVNFNPIPNSAEEYIDSAGTIFNFVWHTEIDLLHYIPPPLDDSDGTYHVVVHNLDAGLYGQTDPDPNPINRDRKSVV